jgi:Putative peptidoglycan binding domain
MPNWNESEITPEDEDSIIREVFPELSGETESERGPYSGWQGQRVHSAIHHQPGYRQNFRQSMRGRSYGRGQQFGLRNRISNTGFAGAGGGGWGRNSWRRGGFNAPYGSPQWAQSALNQTVGPWVGNSGQMDSPTRRGLRIFQSRYRLPVTGGLDNDTLQALLNAVNQQPAPPDDATAAPPAPYSAAPPDAGAAAPPPAPPAGAAPGEYEIGETQCPLCRSLASEYGYELS